MGVTQPTRIYPTPTSLPKSAKSKRLTIPPPVGGWNTRDDPVRMSPEDAYELINFYPEINQVSVRRGNTQHATGVGSGNVDTVVEFFDGSNRRLLAASPTNIYNATTAGAAVSLASGFTNGRWQTATFNSVMGLVNGEDAPQTYDGTSIAAMTVSGTTTTELIGINIFKSRSYFWKNDSPSFWYSAVNALGGALTEFQLGRVTRKGGFLVSMTNWTVDGGSGPDDYAVFIMSSGEVVVYQGSDPGSSADWALVGVYNIPRALSIRSVENIGGQIALLTESDIVFLPQAFDRPSPPSSKLKGAIELSGPSYRANYGWECLYYNKRNMLILNVPISDTLFEQYVMNMETSAPARFIGWNARSFTEFDGDLYFGGTDGRVFFADNGANDDGANINADAGQAWTDLSVPGSKKVEAYKPVFSGLSTFRVGAAISYDYRKKTVDRVVTTGGGATAWGSPWGSPWSSTLGTVGNWKTASGKGDVMSLQVSLGVNGSRPAWYRTEYLVGGGMNI